jgi:hypothetical protein
MKNAILAAVMLVLFASPALAQARRYTTPPRNPVIVRTPPSSAFGAAGASTPTTSSQKSMYPKPIEKKYEPGTYDPTIRNQKLSRP